MSRLFEELDYRVTTIGELSLRRRRDLETGRDIYEIKLGDEYLMSSRFTVSEEALGRLGVCEHPGPDRGGLSVAVGGLGLGYTARAALATGRVAEMVLIEALEPVIDWHRQGLLPVGRELAADPRCRFVCADFFALLGGLSVGTAAGAREGCAVPRVLQPPAAGTEEVQRPAPARPEGREGRPEGAAPPSGRPPPGTEEGLDPEQPGRRFDVVLLDIDHAPDRHLDPRNASFYGPEGLRRLAANLAPGGVFGLWSDDPPDQEFPATLRSVFSTARAEKVCFHNPRQDRTVVQTVYLARR